MSADPGARLVGTLLEVLLAELAEPGRLRRGRTYARQGAVGRLLVLPGLVTADVQGSERHPYEVSVRVPLVPRGDRLPGMIPGRRDLRITCTCPDDDVPCKHACAVLALLAERVVDEPELFLRWRTGDDTTPRVAVGAAMGAALGAAAGSAPALDAEALAELAGVLGTGLDLTFGVPDLPPAPPPAAPTDTWAAMLADAIDCLRTPSRVGRQR